MKELDEITGAIVDAAMQIHRQLGPGLLESVYEVVLAQSLKSVACRSSGSGRWLSNMTASRSRKDFGWIFLLSNE